MQQTDRSEAYVYIFSFSLLFTIICLLIGLCAVTWAWGSFLDNNEHNPGRVRARMFLVLLCVALSEIGLALCGVLFPRTALVSTLVNVWGPLDAVLRFPAAHDLESFFFTKQLSLTLLKTFAIMFGMTSFRMHIAKGLVLLLFDTWGLPVLYLMALPLDVKEQVAKDERDVDLVVRLWRLVFHGVERRRCIALCQKWWYRHLKWAGEDSKLAPWAKKIAICHATPEHKRLLQKQGRAV